MCIATSLLLVYTTSCDESNIRKDSDKAMQPEESAIAQRGKELGKEMVVRDVTVSDASGSNKVVIRFGAVSKEVLDLYLASHNYSIMPILSREDYTNGLKLIKSNQKAQSEPKFEVDDNFVITEVVSKSLQPDAIGFRTHVKSKPVINGQARTVYLQSAEHTSPNWCEGAYILCNNYQIDVDFYEKWRWTYGWSWVAGVVDMPAGFAWSPYYDGPWRLRLNVRYDTFGDYSYTFLCD